MNRKVLRTAIIICWVMLAVCFIIKIFGGKYFEITTNNETFKAVCEYVDNQVWCRAILSFAVNLLIAVLINLAVLRQKVLKWKQAIIVIICSIVAFSVSFVGTCIENMIIDIIGFALSFLPMLICPMILSKKPLRSILAVILYLAFQGISVIVKGLSISQINNDSSLVGLIFSIDVYIMLILYYLYSIMLNKKQQDSESNKIN